jgi:hypothetical protein
MIPRAVLDANVLVAEVVRDFPSRIGTARLVHSDEFTLECVMRQPERALRAIDTMCARRTRSMPSRIQLIEALAQNRLTATAEHLSRLGGQY